MLNIPLTAHKLKAPEFESGLCQVHLHIEILIFEVFEFAFRNSEARKPKQFGKIKTILSRIPI